MKAPCFRTFLLTIWMMALTLFSTHLRGEAGREFLSMGLVILGSSCLLTVSHPFERLIPAAADGRDLNQTAVSGNVMHPPMLYMASWIFRAFAFAIKNKKKKSPPYWAQNWIAWRAVPS